MAQKRRRGYRAPSNYEPGRGKKPRGRYWAEPSGDRSRGHRDPDGGGPDRRGSDSRGSERGDARDRSLDHHGSDRRADAGSARVFAFDTEGRAKQPRDDGHAESAEASDGAAARYRSALGDLRASGVPAERAAPEQTSVESFAELGLGGNIVRTLGELGAERPFPIQAATIPDALAGRDVLGRGRTGSGKTIAFGAPLVERLLRLKAAGAFAADPTPAKKQKRVRGERTRGQAGPGRKPKALILAPTRELALQIDRTVQPIARSVGLYTAQLVGGVPIDPQLHALERGVDVVIGTPGRIQDLVTRRKLDLRQVVISVVDEADHMCELGFLEPVQRILRKTVRGSQRLLFSATLDADVRELVDEFLRDPAAHDVTGGDAPTSRHRVFLVLREDKQRAVLELLRQPGRIIAFCRTRAYAETVTELALAAGIRAVPLHGDLKQAVRERNLARFAEGKADVLVATDVAARGIHVDAVDLVVQLDPPDGAKTYLHRAGRTGRAGSDGEVVTLIPRTRQKRTRELFDELGLEPEFFGDYPG